jgi:hypothetical protein
MKVSDCNRMESVQEYDLTKVTVPIDLHYADNDWLASPVVCMKQRVECR